MTPSKEVPILILLCGFPDRAKSWSRITPHFEQTHHIIALHLPGYHQKDIISPHFLGYSFNDIVAGLAAVIEPHYKAGSKIHFVGHDWGSILVQLYAIQFPETLDKVVLLDVGKDDQEDFSLLALRNSVLTLMYFFWFAISFLISRISSIAATIFLACYPMPLLGPVPYEVCFCKPVEFSLHCFCHSFSTENSQETIFSPTLEGNAVETHTCETIHVLSLLSKFLLVHW